MVPEKSRPMADKIPRSILCNICRRPVPYELVNSRWVLRGLFANRPAWRRELLCADCAVREDGVNQEFHRNNIRFGLIVTAASALVILLFLALLFGQVAFYKPPLRQPEPKLNWQPPDPSYRPPTYPSAPPQGSLGGSTTGWELPPAPPARPAGRPVTGGGGDLQGGRPKESTTTETPAEILRRRGLQTLPVEGLQEPPEHPARPPE
jgi:hypothetical protein